MLIINVIIISAISHPYQSALLSHSDLVDIGINSAHGILPFCIWFMVLIWLLTIHYGAVLIYIVSMAVTTVHFVVSFSRVVVCWVDYLHVGGRHDYVVHSGLIVHVW